MALQTFSAIVHKEDDIWRRFKLRKDYLTLMKKKLHEQIGVREQEKGFGVLQVVVLPKRA